MLAVVAALGFNSLQTGKYIQRIEPGEETADEIEIVSIPFKRESISKDCIRRGCANLLTCFNSLQTGKYIQSKPGRRHSR